MKKMLYFSLLLSCGFESLYAMEWTKKLFTKTTEENKTTKKDFGYEKEIYEIVYRDRQRAFENRQNRIDKATGIAKTMGEKSAFYIRSVVELERELGDTYIQLGCPGTGHDLGCREGSGNHCIEYLKTLRFYNELSRP